MPRLLDTYGPLPFYFINTTSDEDLSMEAIRKSMAEVKAAGFGGIFFFNKPPCGFTPQTYLSDWYFEVLERFILACRENGLALVANDGFNFPPGDVAGRIAKVAPWLKQLRLKPNPEGRLEVLETTWGFPAFEEQESSRLFIEMVYEEHKKRLGKYFGNGLDGFFSDADNRRVLYFCDRLLDGERIWPWSKSFATLFLKRFGYDITLKLKELFNGSDAQVSRDYWALASELYQGWFKNNRMWCNANGLLYCFHSSDTGPLSMRQCYRSSLFSEGATLDMLENSDIPGTDHELLALDGGRHYDSCWEGTKNEVKRWFLPEVTWAGSAEPLKTPEFSKTLYDLRAKYVGCASLLQGKPRALCEMFAATNWGASYQELRRIAVWQIMQGVNMVVPHAVHHRFRGELKYFAPPEFLHNSMKSGLREFNDELAFYCRAAAQGKYIAEVAVIDPTAEIWTGKEPDNFFSICDKLNRYPGGYVICPRERAKEFSTVIDAMSEKELPKLPDTGISFTGGDVAYMRRRLDDGTESLLVANVWSDSELTGTLTFNNGQFSLALAPGEIAVIGGPCERYRKPIERSWDAVPDSTECPVLWRQSNLLPFENSVEFTIASDGIPLLTLEVPTEAVRTVFMDGRQLTECTATMVDDDTYARYDLTRFATKGLHTIEIKGENVEFHTPCRLVGEFDLKCESEGDFHHHAMDTYQLSMYDPEFKRITLSRRTSSLKLSEGWQAQGHVFYSGAVDYDISSFCTPDIGAIRVETNGVAELLIDDVVRQKCVFAPYVFALDNMTPGHRVVLRCSNTMANRMERYAAPSGILKLSLAKDTTHN
ncbi:MAG: hypothetical protein MJ106_02950 [Lentisphaeria bacterium]|nr:hypothetical protein [Lentisphaeria bacterium]